MITLDPKVLKEIKTLTGINHHCEALALGASLVKADKLAEKIKLVAKIRDIDGFLDHDLASYYYRLYDSLMTYCRNMVENEFMTQDSFDQFRAAY
jgi:hypothetical protein